MSEKIYASQEWVQQNTTNFVEKVEGKQLSTEDFTSEEKQKLAGIAAGANAYALPTATSTTKGGVTIGNNITVTEGNISITSQNVTDALGYTPAQSVAIDTSLSISGAAADAKAVGDAFDALDTIIALDENADGNVVLQSYIQADEEGDGYVRLDSSLTVEGIAPDSKAVGDAINLRMLGTAIIPIAQGGHGKTTASEGFKALQSRGVINGDMNEMMTVGVSWVQLSQCTNTPYGNNPESGYGFLEIFDPEEGEIL